MCIIIVKKSGIEVPTKATLKTCWDSNPDGAGFMYLSESNTVIYKKGFMSFNDFYRVIRNTPCIKAETTAVIHFRIATHGAVVPSHTHPFEIGNNDEAVKSLSGECKQAFAHNGIISSMKHKYLSDSQLFCQLILSDEAIHKNLQSYAVQELLTNYIGSSKLAILAPELVLIGDFIEDLNGLLFSNTSYKEDRYIRNSSFFDSWDYDYPNKDPKKASSKCNICCDTFPYEDLAYSSNYGLVCSECASYDWHGYNSN